MKPFINCHVHLFNSNCAPDYYFRMVLPKALDPFANLIKAFLEKKTTRWVVQAALWTAIKVRGGDTSALSRYLEFVKIGSAASQADVFNQIRPSYNQIDKVRYIALTLNMDHMAHYNSTHPPIDSQLREIIDLKKTYPDNLFPFISLDPRHLGDPDQLLAWMQQYMNNHKFFYGIKIYPAKGFFPFDPALDKIYAFAETNQIPIMTHCTRVGSYYIDTIDRSCVNENAPTLNNNPALMDPIRSRIRSLLADVKTCKDNKIWCNIFTHPEHYLPVLEKYPDLKLCFAHYGGDKEVNRTTASDYPAYLSPNWHDLINQYLRTYPNVYTDISYTLSNADALKKIKPLIASEIGHKILFGTDYYMVQQENPEKQVLGQAIDILGGLDMDKIARDNADNYLRSVYYS